MKLSARIMAIFDRRSTTLQKILEEYDQSTFGILLVILSLPSALPVPAPGYSTPFGVVLVLLGLQIILGKKVPWIPKKLRVKEIQLGAKKSITSKIESFTRFFERFIKPRLEWLYREPFYRFHGVLVLLSGASMIIPLPLTNTPPAMGVFLIGIGMLEHDGFFGVVGWIVSLLGVTLTISILVFGFAAVEAVVKGVF